MATEFNLGRHEAQIEQLVSDMAQTRADIKEIRDILAEQRGARKVALWVASGAGAAASGLVAFVIKVIGWAGAMQK